MMLPVLRPRLVQGHVRPAWIWLSGIATGFLVGIFILCLMFMAADFAWTQEFPTDIRDGIALTGLLLAGTSWLLSIPLIYAFMRRRPHESSGSRLILARRSACSVARGVISGDALAFTISHVMTPQRDLPLISRTHAGMPSALLLGQ